MLNVKRKRLSNATIKDVATEAGVSAQAVSLVINNRDGVSEATRARIKDAIKKLNYTPRAWAQAMRGSGTRVLGFIYPIYSEVHQERLSVSGHLEEILGGAVATANRKGYHVLLYSLGHNDEAKKFTAPLEQSRIDGLVRVISDIGTPYLNVLEGLDLPVVEVQRPSNHAYTVCADDRGGTRAAVDYLVRRGHKHIAYLGQGLSSHASKERHAGYLEGLEAHGMEINDHFIRHTNTKLIDCSVAAKQDNAPEMSHGLEDTLELLSLPEPPSAVVCFNDMLAVGALRAARLRKIDIPANLAVIGFGNFGLAAASEPPLTTVDFPAYKLGARAAGLIIDLIEGRQPEERHVVLPITLVARSTA